MFGAKNMTDCTEITERLAIKEDGWEMTRIYTYADGTSKSVIGENENYYCLVPAAPGWIAATDSYYDGEPARDHHTIAMWKYIIDGRDYQVMPLIPGDNSMNRAVAVFSPDGRVFEVSARGVLENKPYPSVKARNIQMGDMKALARERNREAARPGSGIENRAHTAQPRRDLALQVCLLNDVVGEQAFASRFLSRLGRKIPKSLTDIFRIWHGASHLMTRSPLTLPPRFAGNGPKAARPNHSAHNARPR